MARNYRLNEDFNCFFQVKTDEYPQSDNSTPNPSVTNYDSLWGIMNYRDKADRIEEMIDLVRGYDPYIYNDVDVWPNTENNPDYHHYTNDNQCQVVLDGEE